jgi:hypothetical protein
MKSGILTQAVVILGFVKLQGHAKATPSDRKERPESFAFFATFAVKTVFVV